MCRTAATIGLLLVTVWALNQPAPDPSDAEWKAAAARVHARFTGRRGTFAQFGDSITVTQAYWSPLLYARKNVPLEMEAAFQKVKESLRPECWSEWKGPEYGSEGGKTVGWALENVDAWLKKLNPEVALIMFGSNDLPSISPDEYRDQLRRLVQKCLDNGTVVILSTIPPRHGFERKSEQFAAAARDIARDLHLPLIDFHAEILKRRPSDWDGALGKFSTFEGYDVPTLMARDGLHPSHPKQWQDDYSPEGLRNCGYSLRSFLTLMKYAEVQSALSAAPPAAATAPEPLHPPSRPWFPKAPPLPAPRGEIIRVSTADELYAAADRVKPGGTILLADGFYRMPRPLEIRADGVALRGASGDREKVILDAGNEGELIRLTHCSDNLIADLTVQNVRWNGIKLNSETGVHRLTIHNCILHNIWQRFVKGVLVPIENREQLRPSGCVVEYCLFYNDHPKRFEDDYADTAQNFGGNYIGGIDLMYPRDWVIRDNVFVGIHGRTGECRGCVFLWHDTIGCVVERNIIIDCDSGICLGNSFKREDTPFHCTRCIVRNNFVTRAHENGILADYTKDCQIVNNTIYDPQSPLGRLIRLVHENPGLLVANNLVCGPKIRNESASQIRFQNNLERDVTSTLAAPAEGDLHITARAIEAIDHGQPLPDVRDDIDGHPRGPKPDIGAHELKPQNRP